ncbi:oxidoreductase [Desulfosarcina alkanivorans]|uniref:Oxidoreductase n=1 Tax=Desulfosarcina alkanivorans TaxID=571177 RepID=A0A5K7YKH0_9BACT|nr:GMC family oxidoreductase [Desulfosarcina alkanivorans]BBO68885.1 oxidoreductase [Desulfosarcina alkanivorans]
MTPHRPTRHDYIIVGAGISGPFIAHELCRAGADCLMIEAGRHYSRRTYPRNDLDGTAQLYWSGGLELGTDARLVFLRPKVVGGGSVVNQALVDRFDAEAFDSWRRDSGVDFFNEDAMAPWYDAAEAEIAIQTIPGEYRNRNADVFEQGFQRLGYQLAPLRRAQKDCHYEQGNCCIECLNGCRIGSKQSTPETVLKKALERGLELRAETEAVKIDASTKDVWVTCRTADGGTATYRGRNLVLASGAIGNARLLLNSGFGKGLPAVGRNFFCHPQYMNFGVYDQPVRSHLGAFQAFKSDDAGFRKNGFKLENVYAGPAAIALLLSGFGRQHQRAMERLSHFACIEVCTRDTHPGRIKVNRRGKVIIVKEQNREDLERYRRGLAVIDEIFQTTGAKEMIHGKMGIGLHLMGGCGMGTDPARSVVNPGFRLHGHKHIYCADSSMFPNAPGINPSLTIMALSKKAAAQLIKDGNQ